MISFSVSAQAAIEALGAEQDWAFTPNGNAFWQDNVAPNGAVVFDGGHEGDTAELTACAVAVLDSIIPDETACEVTLSNPSDAGTIYCIIKGGDPVAFVFPNGGSEITHTVVSGIGSGLKFVAGDDLPQSQINAIHIEAPVS